MNRVWSTFIDYFLPKKCFYCRKLSEFFPLCYQCLQELSPTLTPKNIEGIQGNAILHYDNPIARKLILGYKHGDLTFLANFFVTLIGGQIGEEGTENTLLLPVPLHWTRLWRRQYNQSGLLAQKLGKLWGIPVFQGVTRIKKTKSQGHLKTPERLLNLAGAFQISQKN